MSGEGDQFIDRDTGDTVWTALHDAKVYHREVHIQVRFAVDGGASTRVWDADDESFMLTIRRK